MASTTTEKKKKTEHEWNLTVLSRNDVELKATHRNLRMVQILHDVDFRYGHDGLADVCKKKGIDVTKLEQGNFVAAFNTAKNSIKLIFGPNDIFYHRESRKLDERILEQIQKQLNMNGKIVMDNALKAFLVKELKRRGRLPDEDDLKSNTKIN